MNIHTALESAKSRCYEQIASTLALVGIGNLPNTFLVGAIRSGTTSLASYLADHPNATYGLKKEPGYFTRYDRRPITFYKANFPRFVDTIVDATPDYLFQSECLQRITEIVDAPRILVMLRDPVARALSHFEHARKHGWADNRSWQTCMDPQIAGQNILRMKRGEQPDSRHLMYLEQSCYDFQIARVKSLFSQVHLMRIEDWLSTPQTERIRLADFLGLDPEGLSPHLPHLNRGNRQVRPLLPRLPDDVISLIRKENTLYYSDTL